MQCEGKSKNMNSGKTVHTTLFVFYFLMEIRVLIKVQMKTICYQFIEENEPEGCLTTLSARVLSTLSDNLWNNALVMLL